MAAAIAANGRHGRAATLRPWSVLRQLSFLLWRPNKPNHEHTEGVEGRHQCLTETHDCNSRCNLCDLPDLSRSRRKLFDRIEVVNCRAVDEEIRDNRSHYVGEKQPKDHQRQSCHEPNSCLAWHFRLLAMWNVEWRTSFYLTSRFSPLAAVYCHANTYGSLGVKFAFRCFPLERGNADATITSRYPVQPETPGRQNRQDRSQSQEVWINNNVPQIFSLRFRLAFASWRDQPYRARPGQSTTPL